MNSSKAVTPIRKKTDKEVETKVMTLEERTPPATKIPKSLTPIVKQDEDI